MEPFIEALAQRGVQALFSGLKQITRDKGTRAITNVPYGELARQTLDIYLPQAESPRYTVMFIHGGFWQLGNKDQYAYVGHALAKRGIACVVINYHLYPKATYPYFIEDAVQALTWLYESGGAYGLQQAPLFLMGHSAGAHIALLSVLNQSFAAQLPFPVNRVKGVVCLAGVYSFRPEKSETFQKIFPKHLSGDQYALVKPVNFVQPDGIPIYIIHGRKDKTVACRSAERMYKNALLAGHPVFLEVRENYGHIEPLLEFIDYWPNHKNFMASLESFMGDHSE